MHPGICGRCSSAWESRSPTFAAVAGCSRRVSSLSAIRRITATLLALALCASCSASDDAPAASPTSSSTTTTTVVLYTEDQCGQQAQAAVVPLQDFIDQY